MKDKGYELTSVGRQVCAYLYAKRKRLTDGSYREYKSALARFSSYFADVQFEQFGARGGVHLVEEFLDYEWGSSAGRTYNKGLSIVRDFFRWHIARDGLLRDPTLLIERAKSREVHRTTFSKSQRSAIVAAAPQVRDRIALRLLFDCALRKGSLRAVQINHFDHERRRLVVFSKGQKVRELPIPSSCFWTDLERHILESEAQPDHYLMARRTGRYGKVDPTKPMGANGLHGWWYRCLVAAGIVPEGTTSGERMHKARHTAGQRVLDVTGNLKAVQQLLGHASIQTTGDIYTDWDIDRLATTMSEVYSSD